MLKPLEEIKAIDFNTPEIQESFDEIEKENKRIKRYVIPKTERYRKKRYYLTQKKFKN